MIIKIKNLKLITNLGVYDWEKNFDRDILVNATIETKEINSTKSDILSETIDYDVIVSSIKEVIKNNQFQLIEKLTQEIVDKIMEDKRITKTTVEVDKLKVFTDVDAFSVIITKTR